MLVATPGRVATLLEAEALNLEDCRAVVLDEVGAHDILPRLVGSSRGGLRKLFVLNSTLRM